jgi:hypothetical protein
VYVAVEDAAGHVATVAHPELDATTLAAWQDWAISPEAFSAAGVNIGSVKTVSIGVGDPRQPAGRWLGSPVRRRHPV